MQQERAQNKTSGQTNTPIVVTETCEIIPESKERMLFDCGHHGPSACSISFWGEKIHPTPEYFEKHECCPECLLPKLLKYTIRCAHCGLRIVPGDGITLSPVRTSHKPEWVTRHNGQAICCMRWDCCPSGGLFVGNWDGEQVVLQ